jgi:hypothetical protein
MLPKWFAPRYGDCEFQYTPDRLPEKAQQTSPHKHVPDFIVVGGVWCVSELFKDLVEQLEPRRHRFYPLPMYRPDGSLVLVPVPHFIFDNTNAIDAVVVEQSEVTWSNTMLFGVGGNLAIDFEGRHVWRGKTQVTVQTFFSDDLKEAVERLKLKKLRYEQTRVAVPAK